MVRFAALDVMIGVTLQFEEKRIRPPLRCVPRVLVADPLIFSRGHFTPPQPIMLDVVDYL